MNGYAHAAIMTEAFHALPTSISQALSIEPELLAKSGNYPDFFDDPTRTEKDKAAIDPDWRRFCEFPPRLEGRAIHQWPGEFRDMRRKAPLIRYLLEQMIESRTNQEVSAFIKFSGCLSHFFGDTTQPAHLGADKQMSDIREMLPVPEDPAFAAFNYHTSIEAVTGKCGALTTPAIQGTSAVEATWRLSFRCRAAMSYCRRFIVPITQALFRGDLPTAAAASCEPITLAAQLSADAMATACAIADGSFGSDDVERLREADLRLIRPDRQFHDMVYGEAILDGNKNVPPNNVSPTPAVLRFPSGVHHLAGLGVLPHSGMSGPRECRMEWGLPLGVFRRFSAVVGMHADLAKQGAASFHVRFDGAESWSSGRMVGSDNAKQVNIEVPSNAETIELVVVDANDGRSFWKNHAFWGIPTLSK